jgi:pimeloyl-ACP methyl ester carboxylesterase
VLSLDLRNHGASPHVDGMGYHDMAADVLETLGAAGGLPAAMLGHSMGGKVAMMAALTRPDAVACLIVADIAPVSYRHKNASAAASLLGLKLDQPLTRQQADAMLAASIPDAAIRGFLLQNLVLGPAPHWKIGLAEIAEGLAAIEAWPAMPAEARYPGPALFIAGGASDYITTAHQPAIAAVFPRARQASIAGAGHWLHAEQPDAFAALVAGFLAENHAVT